MRRGGPLLGLFLTIVAGGLASSSTASTQEAGVLRAFTVKDAIERSTIAEYGGHALEPSPDGRSFAFISSKGDLASGTVRSTVWIVSQDKSGRFKAAAAPERSSLTNDEPVSSLRWVDKGRALAFLSPDEAGFRQVFRYDIASGQSQQITHVRANVVSFDLKGDDCVFYAVERGSATFPAPGGYLSGESLLGLLIPDQNNLQEQGAAYVQKGAGPAFRVTAPIKGYAQHLVNFAISPAGDKAVAMLPASPDPSFLAARAKLAGAPPLRDNMQFWALQANLIDLADGTVRPLLSAPTGGAVNVNSTSQILWSPDGATVIVTNTLLGPKDLPVNSAIPAAPQTVEIDPRRVNAVRVLPTDDRRQPGERVAKLRWSNVGDLVVESASGAGGGEGISSLLSNGHRWRSTFARAGDQWVDAGRTEIPLASRLQVGNLDFFVREDANTPPQIVGQEAGTSKQKFLLDPNPQLKDVRLYPIKSVDWTDEKGHKWSGGLILPQARAAKGLPLVIELKFFDPTRFSPDGPYTTAFASQALAAKGFAVLELNAFDPATMETAQEGPMQMRGVESAIDFLVSRYQIDPTRVGLIGFSRTCYHVTYTLTHSTRRFAAATIADGLSGGYVQYYAYSLNHTPYNGIKPLYDQLNGGPPWGATLQNWVGNSPDMNAGKISAPLRIEMLGRSSVLQEWEIYSALRLQNKPVEALYLPDAPHVLVKPQERYLSQQGNVNWFSFWLLGQAARDQENQKDFERWEGLRKLPEKSSLH